jgi:uncharacterized protein
MNKKFAAAMRWTMFVAAVAIGMTARPPLALAAEGIPPQGPAITVGGTAEVAVAPNRAVVTIGAIAEGQQAQEAQRQIAVVLQRVIKEIRALGIAEEKIRSTGVSLTPVYAQPGTKPAPNPDAPRIVGYRAFDSLRVQIDQVERVGAVIDAAIGAGANNLGGLVFDLQDDLPYRRQALQAAVQEARVKAEALAAGLNLQLGEVLDIREEGAHAPYPAERRFASPAAAATPIQPGQVQVGAAVTVRFKLVAPQK